MTKEQLLKDLCGRLPYGVKIKTSFDKIDEPIELKSINMRNGTFSVGGEYTTISGISLNTYECKPYLFPLTMMTKEQTEEYNLFFAKPQLCLTTQWLAIRLFDWLNENHIDYRGLIEEGLAIDATGLNIYKEEAK